MRLSKGIASKQNNHPSGPGPSHPLAGKHLPHASLMLPVVAQTLPSHVSWAESAQSDAPWVVPPAPRQSRDKKPARRSKSTWGESSPWASTKQLVNNGKQC